MKIHRLSILILFAFLTQSVFAQTAYYDAIQLKSDTAITVTSKEIDTFFNAAGLAILKKYSFCAGANGPCTTKDALSLEYSQNPFLKDFFKTLTPEEAPALANLVGSAGNLNVTSFADGLAKLIVSRVKADLNTYFFQKFQTFLNEKCPELKVLFPNTSLLINNFASTDYSNILNTLREAFDKDLHSMLADIPNLDTLNPKNYPGTPGDRIKNIQDNFLNTDVGITFLSAVTLGNGFVSGQKFPDILDSIAIKYFLKWTDADATVQNTIRSSIDLLAVLSSSVRSNQVNVNYVSLDNLNTLLKDPLARQFYLGLIWQQLHNHNDQIGNVSLSDLVQNDASGAITYIQQLIPNGSDLSSAVSALLAAKKKGETDLSSYYAAIFESANQLLTVAQNIQVINPALSFPKPLQNIFSYGADITDIAHDVAIKNYNAALVSLQKYLSDIVAQGKNHALDTALQNFMKYASFAANIVLAKTSDDVQNAIEAIALPAGSSVTQRNTYFNISINAYGGGFAGKEYMPTLKIGRNAWSAGVTAPVGFAFTFGNLGRSDNLKNSNGKSLTFFVPLIDVGALAAFRFQNDSSNTASNVQLKNILAPGLYAYFGFGKCPLSLGFGAQIGPQLRSVSATDINTNKNFYIRYGLNLLIDVPLFNLFTNNNHGNKNIFNKPTEP
jgi:hypothetical protein